MLFRAAILFSVTLTTAQFAESAQITVDRNGYQGSYEIPSAQTIAPDLFDLAPGQHNLIVSNGVSFQIDIDNTGKLKTLNSDAAQVEPGNVLKFKTVEIGILSGNYIGYYSVRGVDEQFGFGGDRNFTVIRGLSNYILDFGQSNNFLFDVSADGKVTPQNPINASPNDDMTRLTLNTQRIVVKPGGYQGKYSVRAVSPVFNPGQQDIQIVPGVVGYILDFSPSNNFRFDVGDDSFVKPQTASAEAGFREMTLNTVAVEVAPKNYTGSWEVIVASAGYTSGPDVVILPVDVKGYSLAVAAGKSERFDVDADGNPSPNTIKIELSSGSVAEFELKRKADPKYKCEFSTKLILREDLGTLKRNDVVSLSAAIETSNTRKFGINQTHTDWTGTVTITDPATGETLSSNSGMTTTLWHLPTASDSFNIQLRNLNGLLGGLTFAGNNADISLYEYLGENELLKSSDFPTKYSIWNSLNLRRHLNIYANGTGFGFNVGAIESSAGACVPVK